MLLEGFFPNNFRRPGADTAAVWLKFAPDGVDDMLLCCGDDALFDGEAAPISVRVLADADEVDCGLFVDRFDDCVLEKQCLNEFVDLFSARWTVVNGLTCIWRGRACMS